MPKSGPVSRAIGSRRSSTISKSRPARVVESGLGPGEPWPAARRIGNYDDAVSHYESARHAEDADVPIHALEQEANLRARAAAQRRASAADGRDVAQAQAKFLQEIEVALQLMRAALELGKTAERHGIEASIHKRKAVWAPSIELLKKSLAAMRTAYGHAVAIPGQGDNSFLNWIVARAVLRWFAPDEPDLSAADLERIEEEIHKGRRRAAADPTFWNLLTEPDARLARHLAAGAPGSLDATSLIDGYRRAKDEFGSLREVATVIEHLAFIQRMAQLSNKEDLAQTLELAIGKLGQ